MKIHCCIVMCVMKEPALLELGPNLGILKNLISSPLLL